MQTLRLFFVIFSKTTFWTLVVYDLDGSIDEVNYFNYTSGKTSASGVDTRF